MEALLSQFSSLAKQALEDKSFDPSRIEDLMKLFEAEAGRLWSAAEAELQKAAGEAQASMREAESFLNSLMDTATDDYWRTDEAIRRATKHEPASLILVAKGAKKKGHAHRTVTSQT